MLNADLILSNDFQKWQRRRKDRRKSPKQKPKEEEEPGFHFIAYVPIDGEVWKLDGIEARPINLGPSQDDWVALARANINKRISQYENDGVQFNLLALCKSPLMTVPNRLAQSMQGVLAAEAALDSASPGWKQFIDSSESVHNGFEEAFGISKIMKSTKIAHRGRERLEAAGGDPSILFELHGEWTEDMRALQTSFMEEVALIGHENEQATRWKKDNTPVIYKAIKALTEEGLLQQVVHDVHGSDGLP